MNDLQIDSASRDSSSRPNSVFASVFLVIFATPFAGFGLFALVQGVRKWTSGNTRDGVALCVFGLVFSTIGFGLMFAAIWSRKKTKQAAELQARNADRPWLLRPDWAAGKIKSTAMSQPVIYLIMALGFCGIGGLGTFLSLPGELHKKNYAALLILLFPAVGIGFLIAFISALSARLRYGACYFELAQVPIPLGGTVEGMIQTGARFQPEHGLHLKISCIRRVVSGSGKNRNVSESTLWQDEKVFRPGAGLPQPEAGHTGIPVYFKLPDGQPQCFNRGDTSVLWRLEARAKMAGPDFSAAFEVPVFHVAGATTTSADETDPTAALQMPVEEIRRDEHSRIKVTDCPGGREFYFPAARNIKVAFGTTLMALIFDTGVGAMIHFHLEFIFPLVLGLFGLLLSCFAFNLWFKSSRVTINSTGVNAVTHYPLFRRTRQFAAGDVSRFSALPGMTSGSQVYMDIRLVPSAGTDDFGAARARYQQTGQSPPPKFRVSDPRGIAVASGIASTVEAEWLAREMNRALGKPV